MMHWYIGLKLGFTTVKGLLSGGIAVVAIILDIVLDLGAIYHAMESLLLMVLVLVAAVALDVWTAVKANNGGIESRKLKKGSIPLGFSLGMVAVLWFLNWSLQRITGADFEVWYLPGAAWLTFVVATLFSSLKNAVLAGWMTEQSAKRIAGPIGAAFVRFIDTKIDTYKPRHEDENSINSNNNGNSN